MNVHVRLFTVSAVAALATLAVSGTSLAAQSASQDVSAGTSAAFIVPAPSAPLTVTPSLADSTMAASAEATTTVSRGPSLASARVASHAVSTSRGAPPVIQNRKSGKNSVALMIVGGAALVVGAVIGDDAGTLVMLGGAAVGLYGLYLFLT